MQRLEDTDTTPIACDLGVFDADERARHQGNAEAVLISAQAIVETASGYTFQLPGDVATLQGIGAFIARESRCCPFFRFDLTVRPGDEQAWLEISGSAALKGYLAAELLAQQGPHLGPKWGPGPQRS